MWFKSLNVSTELLIQNLLDNRPIVCMRTIKLREYLSNTFMSANNYKLLCE